MTPPLVGRLTARDRALRTFSGVFEGKVRIEPRSVRDNRRLADPSPNAPLLIRIVRYPYAESVSYGRRRQVFEPAKPTRARLEPREAPVAEVRSLRDVPVQGNPIRALDIHPAPLAPPPSVEDWLAASGSTDGEV